MSSTYDPIPPQEIPKLETYAGPKPTLPRIFSCSALLHPFAPPPTPGSQPDVPFYQLCTANIQYVEGLYFSAQLSGTEYGSWWYVVRGNETQLSTDHGQTWSQIETGWAVPGTDLLGPKTRCAGQSPFNWMKAQNTSWWTSPVDVPGNPAKGATWMWFDTATNAPVRIMFGVQPKTPTTGTPDQLPLLQNFSFTYFTNFMSCNEADESQFAEPGEWQEPDIQGFRPGNPDGYPLWDWASNQGLTVFMTPVNQKYDPLPTRVLYRWDPDPFESTSIRSQSTLMRYAVPVPPENYSYQLALLQRQPAPARNYDAFYGPDGMIVEPKSSQPFPFDTEPPNWVSLGDGQIKATISDNPDLCPNNTVTVASVMFPPAKNYPQGTYLWTWYSPLAGTLSRPVVFMQSASSLGVGTSLALADYFYFETYNRPIDAQNFVLPQSIPV